MTKKAKKDITILNIGDRVDYDSFQKLDKEKRFASKAGFYYRSCSYDDLLEGRLPRILTEKVVVFFFFPFNYWDSRIEHRRYKGVYGNKNFFRQFHHFCEMTTDALRAGLPDKKVMLVDDPMLSVLGRDKARVMDKLIRKGVTVPHQFRARRVRDIRALLKEGYSIYIKPKCGSMGKGITFLSLGEWQTNFYFRNGRIVSRKSDKGWKFRDMTGDNAFLGELLKKNIYIEEGIDSLNIKGDKVDLRIYTFIDKALYIYPRRNKLGAVTTNISQGGKGDPELLDVIPRKVLDKAGRMAVRAARALGLYLAGIDVVMDSSLKKAYVVDVNMYPGFPKRKTFNLSRAMLSELKRLERSGKLRFRPLISK